MASDTYLDPSGDDLVGAVRDAKALWALFKDTIPTIDSELLVNHEATCANVKRAILETLGNATKDDDIIITFAGHGTPNHQLVAYDTQSDNLSATTLSMDELADAFKSSKANSILCILDCCFSGRAPARILEDVPTSRTFASSQALITGKGRVLIAAARLDQPAYEHPTHRHGLLTYALIQSLCAKEQEQQLDLAVVVAKATSLVRALAASIGEEQTPVAFNLTEGGLNIAALRPGPLYHEAFPDQAGLRIGVKISELAGFGIPTPIHQAWEQAFPQGLNALQLAAINDYRVLDGKSLLVVAPTSAGKTFIGELAGAKAITDGRKVVFLFPYKALVNEKYEDFRLLYGETLHLRVIRCTGDHLDQTREFLRGKFDIAVFDL